MSQETENKIVAAQERAIKLGFCDFWPKFNPEKFRLFQILQDRFDIELSNQPDYLIYSVFGEEHLKHNCVRIEYSGENTRPNFLDCDFSIGFDHLNDDRYFRYPFYVENHEPSHQSIDVTEGFSVDSLEDGLSAKDIDRIVAQKRKFCCSVISNPYGEMRNAFLEKLSAIKRVDSGGRVMNNIGGPIPNKLNFLANYKFNVAFENSSHSGYVTEKIVEPFYTNTIPIYWGAPDVDHDFDPKAFIWVKGPEDFDRAIEEVLAIDANETLYREKLLHRLFYNGKRNQYFESQRVIEFFGRVFGTKPADIPISQRLNRTTKRAKIFIKNGFYAASWAAKKRTKNI